MLIDNRFSIADSGFFVWNDMINMTSLNKSFSMPCGNTINALEDINCHITRGEIFGIIGKSGAGKSTLLRCLNLLERPTSGHVFLEGEDLTEITPTALRQHRQHIGMIFQHFNLLENCTVYENIALPLQCAGLSKQKIEEQVAPLLELTNLTDKKNAYPNQLSGGQKQRVAIARALANKPKILLCDEATSALDPETTQSILTLLQDINQKFNLTIVLITHEMDVVKQICDRVAILEEGKLVECNTVIGLFLNPSSDTAKSLVKSILYKDLQSNVAKCLAQAEDAGNAQIARLTFLGSDVSEPVISHLIQELNLTVNILHANIEIVKQDTIGTMLIELMGKSAQIEKGIDYLREKGIRTEVISHVADHASSAA